jgi:hypothetical protein
MDERALKLLARTPGGEALRERLAFLARRADALAAADGREIQWEFGREHVAAIVEHNQFVRFFRGGDEPGAVELWLDDAGRAAAQAAGLALKDPAGAVFKMFGWRRVAPSDIGHAAVDDALVAAYRRASREGRG